MLDGVFRQGLSDEVTFKLWPKDEKEPVLQGRGRV